MILELKNKGVSVLFSSHILSDVEELADRVAIINNAGLLFQGDLNELHKAAVRDVALVVSLFEPTEISKWLGLFDDILSITEIKPCVYRAVVKPELALQYDAVALNFLTTTVLANLKVKEFKISGLSLDELFINMAGEVP